MKASQILSQLPTLRSLLSSAASQPQAPASFGAPLPLSPDSLSWEPDILGDDFECALLPLGPDPDGEGQVHAALVHYCSHGLADAAPAEMGSSAPAILWVHGMTDYFFQAHVARHFAAQGYAFYAVDLRKCGRARQEGQAWHYVSDMSLYFQDLEAAVAVLKARGHDSVIPLAHSTGGLICALWLDSIRTRSDDSARAAREVVRGLILNGPWLDMMSVPRPVVRALEPLISTGARLRPRLAFPGGNLTAFGDSIHESRFGEWTYDLALKPLGGHPKFIGWLHAVLRGFAQIRAGRVDVGVPFLTICSTRSHLGKPYSAATDCADAVVDVAQTMRWAPTLGKDCTLRPINNARHDAFLSTPAVLAEVFNTVDAWLQKQGLTPDSAADA